MKRVGALLCILALLATVSPPLVGGEIDPRHSEFVRSGLTIAGAAIGLVVGSATGISFSLDAIDTPLSNALLLTIPVAAAGLAAGALAGRWAADVTLRHQPSPLLAILEGAGLGLVGGALVGGVTFSLNCAIASRILEVPEGYWGSPPIGMVPMSILAGGFWGGFFGMVTGAATVPLISLYLGF